MRANLVKMAFLAVSCLAFTACKSEVEGVSIAPELEPYVASFIQEAAVYGRDVQLENIKIDFASFDNSSYLGVCKDYGDHKEVFISIEYLNKYATQLASRTIVKDVEKVVFHELGHCAEGREHKNSYINGRPESVMNAYALSTQDYEDFHSEYQEELHTAK